METLLLIGLYFVGVVTSFILMSRLDPLGEKGGVGCLNLLMAVFFPIGWTVLYIMGDLPINNPLDSLTSWIRNQDWK